MRGFIGIPKGELLEGGLPKNKMNLVVARIELHRDELMTNWKLAIDGFPIFTIYSLKYYESKSSACRL
jgi:hypothetical protein